MVVETELMRAGLSIGVFLASAMHIVASDSTFLTAIGLVRASGEFTIDGSWTRDNSTVFEGSVISTAQATSHVVLEDGTRIDIGLDSRSRIYRNHVTIEQGLAHINASSPYAVIAGRIRIDSPQGTLVRVTNSQTVAVSSLMGVAAVKEGKGRLIAMVPPGRTLEFSEADTSSDRASVRGCLQRVDTVSGSQTTTHYFLQDQMTNVIVELVGGDLERFAGKTVDATGSIDLNAKPIAGAAYVMRPAKVTTASQQTCPTTVGSASRAAPPALSPSAIGGIIGGAAAGTVGGLAGAGVIGGGSVSTTPSTATR